MDAASHSSALNSNNNLSSSSSGHDAIIMDSSSSNVTTNNNTSMNSLSIVETTTPTSANLVVDQMRQGFESPTAPTNTANNENVGLDLNNLMEINSATSSHSSSSINNSSSLLGNVRETSNNMINNNTISIVIPKNTNKSAATKVTGNNSANKNLTNNNNNETEDQTHQYLCAITRLIMRDPVKNCVNNTYEREAIESWLKKQNRDPLWNVTLQNTELTPDYELKRKIDNYLKSDDYIRFISSTTEAYFSISDLREARNDIEKWNLNSLKLKVERTPTLFYIPLLFNNNVVNNNSSQIPPYQKKEQRFCVFDLIYRNLKQCWEENGKQMNEEIIYKNNLLSYLFTTYDKIKTMIEHYENLYSCDSKLNEVQHVKKQISSSLNYLFANSVKICPSTDFMKFLFKKGASMESTNQFGQNAFLLACEENQIPIITMLIENNVNVFNTYCDNVKLFWNGLHFAIWNEHKSTIDLIVDYATKLDYEPLKKLLFGKEESIALVKDKSSIFHPVDYLSLAFYKKNLPLAKFLIEELKFNFLTKILTEEQYLIIKKIKSEGYLSSTEKVKERLSEELHYMYWNCISNHLEGFIYLYSQLEKLDYENVLLYGNDMKDILLKKEMTKRHVAAFDRSLIHAIAMEGDSVFMQCFIEKCKKLNIWDIVKDMQDSFGNTALHYSCEKNKYDMLKLLLNEGVDIDILNRKGKRAKDLCKENAPKELIQKQEKINKTKLVMQLNGYTFEGNLKRKDMFSSSSSITTNGEVIREVCRMLFPDDMMDTSGISSSSRDTTGRLSPEKRTRKNNEDESSTSLQSSNNEPNDPTIDIQPFELSNFGIIYQDISTTIINNRMIRNDFTDILKLSSNKYFYFIAHPSPNQGSMSFDINHQALFLFNNQKQIKEISFQQSNNEEKIYIKENCGLLFQVEGTEDSLTNMDNEFTIYFAAKTNVNDKCMIYKVILNNKQQKRNLEENLIIISTNYELINYKKQSINSNYFINVLQNITIENNEFISKKGLLKINKEEKFYELNEDIYFPLNLIGGKDALNRNEKDLQNELFFITKTEENYLFFNLSENLNENLTFSSNVTLQFLDNNLNDQNNLLNNNLLFFIENNLIILDKNSNNATKLNIENLNSIDFHLLNKNLYFLSEYNNLLFMTNGKELKSVNEINKLTDLIQLDNNNLFYVIQDKSIIYSIEVLNNNDDNNNDNKEWIKVNEIYRKEGETFRFLNIYKNDQGNDELFIENCKQSNDCSITRLILNSSNNKIIETTILVKSGEIDKVPMRFYKSPLLISENLNNLFNVMSGGNQWTPNLLLFSKKEIRKCFGIFYNDTLNVCSGKGKCISENRCECFDNFDGDECEKCKKGFEGPNCTEVLPIMCFNIFANESIVCSGHGDCISENKCNCIEDEYTGIQCEIPYCFGLKSTDNNVCNKYGKCIDFNDCKCNEEHTGSNCEIYIQKPIGEKLYSLMIIYGGFNLLFVLILLVVIAIVIKRRGKYDGFNNISGYQEDNHHHQLNDEDDEDLFLTDDLFIKDEERENVVDTNNNSITTNTGSGSGGNESNINSNLIQEELKVGGGEDNNEKKEEDVKNNATTTTTGTNKTFAIDDEEDLLHFD
ncbi:hypothetical protein ABK040_008065 [Willaertia magna]